MRTPILITSEGLLLNPEQNILINASEIDGSANSSLFQNQITLEFYNEIIESANGNFEPNTDTAVLNNLSGTVMIGAYSSINSPYPATISPNDTIDISTSNTLQWYGITDRLDITCDSIVGANYILILVDRG